MDNVVSVALALAEQEDVYDEERQLIMDLRSRNLGKGCMEERAAATIQSLIKRVRSKHKSVRQLQRKLAALRTTNTRLALEALARDDTPLLEAEPPSTNTNPV